MKRILSVAMTITVLPGLLTTAASAALAAPSTRQSSVSAAGQLDRSASTQSASAKAAVCKRAVSFYGKRGYALCNTHQQHYSNIQGRERLFVIGANHKVYNIYRNNTTGYVSNWAPLGGPRTWAKVGVYDHYVLGAPLAIQTTTKGGNKTCNIWYHSGWTGWAIANC
jgi:hypothetical protein